MITSIGRSSRLGFLISIVVGVHRIIFSTDLLNKEVLWKGRNLLGDQVIINVVNHLLDELVHKLHSALNFLSIKVWIIDFNLVGIDGVLGEQGKMLEKLVDFSHENKWQMRNRIIIVMHPGLHFLFLIILISFHAI